MDIKRLKQSIKKAAMSLWSTSPYLVGTVFLVSLIIKSIPSSFYLKIFTNNIILDPIVGSMLGSVSAGNPIISYILGGEFLKNGISLLAVTAFLVSWVTVGIVQLPAESKILGSKFAILRNITAFLSAMIVAIITVFLMVMI